MNTSTASIDRRTRRAFRCGFRFLVAFASLATLLSVGTAQAALTWSVSASTSDGSPISAMTDGASLTLTIGVFTTAPGEILALTASVSGYDLANFSLNAAASSVPESLFCDSIPSVGCFNGIANLIGPGPPLPYEETLPGGLGRAVMFDGITVTPHPGTGLGGQFTLVFDPVGPSRLTDTVFNIGVFPSVGDNIAFAGGGGDEILNNAQITIPAVPEPGTALLLGLGLAALARRRPRPD